MAFVKSFEGAPKKNSFLFQQLNGFLNCGCTRALLSKCCLSFLTVMQRVGIEDFSRHILHFLKYAGARCARVLRSGTICSKTWDNKEGKAFLVGDFEK